MTEETSDFMPNYLARRESQRQLFFDVGGPLSERDKTMIAVGHYAGWENCRKFTASKNADPAAGVPAASTSQSAAADAEPEPTRGRLVSSEISITGWTQSRDPS